MTWEDSVALGAKAEKRAIDAFTGAGWCVIAHGAAQVGRLQLPILTEAGEAPSTDFIALKAGDYRMIECKSKEPLGRGGFGLDRDQWETLLAHDRLLPGKTMLLIEDRQQDELLVARIDHLRTSATWSANQKFAMFDQTHFHPLNDFLEGHAKWLS
jgi:Holliday junction resolvase